jgi:hypothetical protein
MQMMEHPLQVEQQLGQQEQLGLFPAHYYLRIYRLKLQMAEDGTTPHKPDWEQFMRRLVTTLSTMDPRTPIRLDAIEGVARFSNDTTGALLGEFRLSDAHYD